MLIPLLLLGYLLFLVVTAKLLERTKEPDHIILAAAILWPLTWATALAAGVVLSVASLFEPSESFTGV